MKSILMGFTALMLVPSAAAASDVIPAHVILDADQKLAEEQVYRYWALDNLSALDPGLMEGTDAADVARQQFEGLFNQDNQGNLVPALAIETIVSEDQKTYTFKLRQNAKWSDGKPVTAHDFVYSWRRVADPQTASNYAYYMEMMQVKNAGDIITGHTKPEQLGIKAVDDYTLQVELENPIPYFTKMLVHFTTLPVPQWAIEEHGDRWTLPENIVVNGAFKLAENNLGENYSVTRNEAYWDNENTVLDKIVFEIVPNSNQAFTRFLAGELDYVEIPAGQYPNSAKQYPNMAHLQPNLCSYYVNFNYREDSLKAFKDPRVRQALSLSVDRDILVEKILQAGQIPAYTFTHQMTAGYTQPYLPWAEWTQEKRDEEARKLLAEAGYGPDNPLTFKYVYNTSEEHRKIAIFLQQQWKQKLGVNIEINNIEWKTLLADRSAGDFEASRNAWCADYNEASTFVDLYHSQSTQNDSKYSNSLVDSLLDMSKTSDNPAPIYTMIEGIVADEAGIVPLYYYTKPFMLNPNVKNWPTENAEGGWYGKNIYFVEPK